jgi:hypothetical protein
LRSLLGPRAIGWLTPIAGTLLAAGVWLSVKDQRDPQVGGEPPVVAQEPRPMASADESTQAAGSPLPERGHEPWQAPTRAQLVQQLESFFGKPWEGKSKVPFTADELCDLELQMRLFDLGFQLGSALNAGVDLRNFEAYGIVLNPDRSITIDDAHPRWTGVDATLAFFRSDSLTHLLKMLRDRGFSEAEVKGVEERAAMDTRPVVRAGDILMRQFVNDIQSGSLSAEVELQRAHEMNYQLNKDLAEFRIKWAIGILAPLDRTKRDILVKVAREDTSSNRTISPGLSRDEVLRESIEAARSGKLSREFQASPSEKDRP